MYGSAKVLIGYIQVHILGKVSAPLALPPVLPIKVFNVKQNKNNIVIA